MLWNKISNKTTIILIHLVIKKLLICFVVKMTTIKI
jgi:hypothetical protein